MSSRVFSWIYSVDRGQGLRRRKREAIVVPSSWSFGINFWSSIDRAFSFPFREDISYCEWSTLHSLLSSSSSSLLTFRIRVYLTTAEEPRPAGRDVHQSEEVIRSADEYIYTSRHWTNQCVRLPTVGYAKYPRSNSPPHAVSSHFHSHWRDYVSNVLDRDRWFSDNFSIQARVHRERTPDLDDRCDNVHWYERSGPDDRDHGSVDCIEQYKCRDLRCTTRCISGNTPTKDPRPDLAEKFTEVVESMKPVSVPDGRGKYCSEISWAEWASLGLERASCLPSAKRSSRLHHWLLVITRGEGLLLHFGEQFTQFSEFLHTHLLRLFAMAIEIFQCRGVNTIEHLQHWWRVESLPAYFDSMAGEQCSFRVRCCCLVTQFAGIHCLVLVQEIQSLKMDDALRMVEMLDRGYRQIFSQRIDELVSVEFLFDFRHHVQIRPILFVLVVIRTDVGFFVGIFTYVQEKRAVRNINHGLLFLKTAEGSERFSEHVSTDIFGAVRLENVGDLGVFHPERMIVAVDWDGLMAETRGRHVNLEDTRIEIIGLEIIGVISEVTANEVNALWSVLRFERIQSLSIQPRNRTVEHSDTDLWRSNREPF